MLTGIKETISILNYDDIQQEVIEQIGVIYLDVASHYRYMYGESKFIVFNFEVAPVECKSLKTHIHARLDIGEALNHLCFLNRIPAGRYTIYEAW